MEDTISAKNKLYALLRGYTEVMGASVQRVNNEFYIVVFLNRLTKKSRKSFPKFMRVIKLQLK